MFLELLYYDYLYSPYNLSILIFLIHKTYILLYEKLNISHNDKLYKKNIYILENINKYKFININFIKNIFYDLILIYVNNSKSISTIKNKNYKEINTILVNDVKDDSDKNYNKLSYCIKKQRNYKILCIILIKINNNL